MLTCPWCGGEVFVLGQLGMMVHFRCRQCGGDFSRPAADCEGCND